MKDNEEIGTLLFFYLFNDLMSGSKVSYKDISEYSDSELKDLQNNIRTTLNDIFGKPSKDVDVQEMLDKLKEYLKSEQVDILKRFFLDGESRELTADEKKKVEIERLAMMAENGENYGIEVAMIFADEKFILDLYKKRKNLEFFESDNASKKAKQDYKKFLESVADTNKDEDPKITKNKIGEFLSIINSVSNETGKSVENIISDYKQMSMVLLSEDVLDKLRDDWTRSNEILSQRQVEALAKEKEEKARIEQENEQKELDELIAKAKDEEEAKLLEKQRIEIQAKNEKKARFAIPIAEGEGKISKFSNKLQEKDKNITVKEYIFPVFIQFYTKKNERLFDRISPEQMQEFVSKLKEYENLSNKRSKFIIITNQRTENLYDWMLELDKFLEKEGMPSRVDSGVAKYGTTIYEMNGNSIPVAKMSPEIREKVEEIVKGEKFSTGLENYINETEKDYLRIDFPKKTKESDIFQTFKILNRTIKNRGDALTFSTFYKGNGKKGIDVILKSQAEIGERLYEYLSKKYFLEPRKGISFTADKIDEAMQKLNIAVEKKKSEEKVVEK
jgi:hypothetical protein